MQDQAEQNHISDAMQAASSPIGKASAIGKGSEAASGPGYIA
ncbi:MAG: hypothetical protein R3F54_12425 [Alphaproteobacteria bacterium]